MIPSRIARQTLAFAEQTLSACVEIDDLLESLSVECAWSDLDMADPIRELEVRVNGLRIDAQARIDALREHLRAVPERLDEGRAS